MGGIKDHSPAHTGRLRIDTVGVSRRLEAAPDSPVKSPRPASRVTRITDLSPSDWVLPVFGLGIGLYLMLALGPLGIAAGLLLIVALFATALQASIKTVCAHCGYVLRSRHARVCLCCKTELGNRSA